MTKKVSQKKIRSIMQKVADWLMFYSLSEYCKKEDKKLLAEAAKRLLVQ